MWTSLRRVLAFVLISILLTGMAYAGGGGDQGPPGRGPIFDITHFDVIPFSQNGVDFEQTAYAALFAYRDASESDPGSKSFPAPPVQRNVQRCQTIAFRVNRLIDPATARRFWVKRLRIRFVQEGRAFVLRRHPTASRSRERTLSESRSRSRLPFQQTSYGLWAVRLT